MNWYALRILHEPIYPRTQSISPAHLSHPSPTIITHKPNLRATPETEHRRPGRKGYRRTASTARERSTEKVVEAQTDPNLRLQPEKRALVGGLGLC